MAIACMGACFWQCSNESENGASLKNALYTNTNRLNRALDKIQSSAGYQLLMAGSQETVKSASVDELLYPDSIRLEDISGIYEYTRPDSIFYCDHGFYNLFEKTGESNNLIVKLPSERLYRPYKLMYPLDGDTAVRNNFIITATDYHFYFSHGYFYDYGLFAGFEQDNTPLGNLKIQSSRNEGFDSDFSSSFTFSEGHSINVEQHTGDTSTYSIALMDGAATMFSEYLKIVRSDHHKPHVFEYALVIGNVMLMKSSDNDSLQIYLNGILQPDAKVEVIEYNDDVTDEKKHSVCHDRDIQITFEDGTVTTISELLGPSKEVMAQLVDSIRAMYFSTKVIDYIAWNIYRTSKLE